VDHWQSGRVGRVDELQTGRLVHRLIYTLRAWHMRRVDDRKEKGKKKQETQETQEKEEKEEEKEEMEESEKDKEMRKGGSVMLRRRRRGGGREQEEEEDTHHAYHTYQAYDIS
jgi:hypothetical protein